MCASVHTCTLAHVHYIVAVYRRPRNSNNTLPLSSHVMEWAARCNFHEPQVLPRFQLQGSKIKLDTLEKMGCSLIAPFPQDPCSWSPAGVIGNA